MNLTKYVWPTQRPLSFITRRNNHQVTIVISTNCDMPKYLFDYIICTYISTSLQNLIHIVQLCIFVRLTFIEVLCLLSHELVKFHLEFRYKRDVIL